MMIEKTGKIYTKEIFEQQLKSLQTISTEISVLEYENIELERKRKCENGKERQIASLRFQKNTLSIIELGKRVRDIGERIATNTSLVSISLRQDRFMKNAAANDKTVETGMKKLSIYGSLEYGHIFEGPNALPVEKTCSLEQFEDRIKNRKKSKIKKL